MKASKRSLSIDGRDAAQHDDLALAAERAR
jgi:hypothetical protein